eukprot:gnl/TRDRNA2_/TRDRNA2_175794_c7_seq27.p1 gnl/TRDRNA2_/TRDRNA2_175794_c7~~gnl/TRDRNA2_/TRDRNA2_175794_c7_seq27.p1  ORF type:complete len:529 (+),score=77.33 gnl/TRDRNA2_/TRDRNA2_175794_c7_seq27:530-2116(+)
MAARLGFEALSDAKQLASDLGGMLPRLAGLAGLLRPEKFKLLIMQLTRRHMIDVKAYAPDWQPVQQFCPDAYGTTDVLMTQNSSDATRWKLKLMREAQKSLLVVDVLAGSLYSMLPKIIADRIRNNPDFRAVVIRAYRDDTGYDGGTAAESGYDYETSQALDVLAHDLPDNVFVLHIPRRFTVHDGWKWTAKVHSRVVLVDGGTLGVSGSSDMADTSFDETNEDFVFRSSKACEHSENDSLWNQVLKSIEGFNLLKDAHGNQGTTAIRSLFKFPTVCMSPESSSDRPDKFALSSLSESEAHVMAQNYKWFLSEGSTSFAPCASHPVQDLAFRCSGPGASDPHANAVLDLIIAMSSSKKRIYLKVLYFNPTQEFNDALVQAARRGVRVKLLVSGRPSFRWSMWPEGVVGTAIGALNQQNLMDLKEVEPSIESCMMNYQKHACKDCQRSHMKTFVVDDTVMFGSANLDFKTHQGLDLEGWFVATSKELADHVAHSQEYAHRKQCSRPEDVPQAPLIGQLYNLARHGLGIG